jgi:hypothetical protein
LQYANYFLPLDILARICVVVATDAATPRAPPNRDFLFVVCFATVSHPARLGLRK